MPKPKKKYITQNDKYRILRMKRIQNLTISQISKKTRVSHGKILDFLTSDELMDISAKGKTTETIILKELTPGFSYVQEKVTIKYERR